MFRMIVDLFNAGTDTTATGLSWAILHLIRNPAVQEKCRAEIMQVKPYLTFICYTILESLVAQCVRHLPLENSVSEHAFSSVICRDDIR